MVQLVWLLGGLVGHWFSQPVRCSNLLKNICSLKFW
ncbi:hypothetical protein LINGRAHAP2_LOCUS5039 [Linum grandiflorum]